MLLVCEVMMNVLQELLNHVRDGDLKSVEVLLSKHEVDLNQALKVAGTGISPLMIACKHGHLDIAKLLLQKGANVNFVNNLNQTALMKAAEGGNVEVVNLLLEHGANCDTVAIDTKTALILACEQGSIEVVEALLVKTEFKETEGFFNGIPGLRSWWKFSCTLSLVFIAVQHGNINLVKWFLRRGYKVPLGALFQAISQQNHDMVKVLLQNGANVNETGESGWTALMQASYLGDSAIISTLLNNERKPDVDHLDRGKNSALMLAALHKHADVVSLLLMAGAKVNLRGNSGRTALFFAMGDQFGILQDPTPRKSVQTVKALLDGGADVNLEDDYGTTPLLLAAGMVARQWRLEVIKLLLEKKAIIDHKNSNGNYALKSAVSTCDIPIARLLLEGGAKIDMKDHEGKSLLVNVRNCIFSTSTAVQMTKLLLDFGLPLSILDYEGRDALLSAVISEQIDNGPGLTTELLLERGANPTLKPDYGSNVKSFLQPNITCVYVSY